MQLVYIIHLISGVCRIGIGPQLRMSRLQMSAHTNRILQNNLCSRADRASMSKASESVKKAPFARHHNHLTVALGMLAVTGPLLVMNGIPL
jgi:hypothetical protein